MNNKLKIFSGRSNPALALGIAKSLDQDLGSISIRTFSDGELWVKYEENVRGCDVFIIQSTNGPSENIIELALMVDAAVRASADTVTVLIPYFGYGRQDRKDQPRVPISSRVMIDILTAMGADRIITLDLHSTQIQGFAKIPFDNLYSRSVLFEAIQDEIQIAEAMKNFGKKVPLLANMVEGGKTPLLSAPELEKLGFSIVIFPGGLVRAFARTAQGYFKSLYETGSTKAKIDEMYSFDELNQLLGTKEILEMGKTYDTNKK